MEPLEKHANTQQQQARSGRGSVASRAASSGGTMTDLFDMRRSPRSRRTTSRSPFIGALGSPKSNSKPAVSPTALETAGLFTPKELFLLGHTAKQLMSTYGCAPRIVQALDGRTARELRTAGYSCEELLQSGGFTIRELKVGGYSASELHALGCAAKDMRAYSLHELRSGGYSASQLRASGFFTIGELKDGGCEATELRVDARYSALELKTAG